MPQCEKPALQRAREDWGHSYWPIPQFDFPLGPGTVGQLVLYGRRELQALVFSVCQTNVEKQVSI